MSIPAFDTTANTTYTQSPNPTWTYGQRVDTTPEGKAWVAGESEGWKVYNTAETDKAYVFLYRYSIRHSFSVAIARLLYKLMISGIVPRPIAFVSTISEQGVENLSPFR
jgi:hypothetical protein